MKKTYESIKLNVGEKSFAQSDIKEVEFKGKLLSSLITYTRKSPVGAYGTCWELYKTSDANFLVWQKNFMLFCDELGVSRIDIYDDITQLWGNVPEELINSII